MLQNKCKLNCTKNQRGNAFIFILIGVVLFAALSFTISRGMRSQTTGNMSSRDADLAATDIVAYTQKITRAVDRVRRNGCSENQISFENTLVAGYTNGSAPGDYKCHIFRPEGGSVSWRASSVNAAEFEYSGNVSVTGLGIADSSELLMVLSLGNQQGVCEKLNTKLGLSSAAPVDEGNNDTFSKFTGTFADAAPTLDQNSGTRSACVDKTGSGDFLFYASILDR